MEPQEDQISSSAISFVTVKLWLQVFLVIWLYIKERSHEVGTFLLIHPVFIIISYSYHGIRGGAVG